MAAKPMRQRTKVKGRQSVYFRDTPRGRRYEVTWVGPDGRRRWKAVDGDLRAAQAALDEVRGRLQRGEPVVASASVTVGEAVDLFLAAKGRSIRRRTLEKYEGNLRRHVVSRFARVRVADLTVDDVARMIRELQDGVGPEGEARPRLAPWSIKGVLVPLSRVLAWCERRGLVASNVVRKLERDERPSGSRGEVVVLDRDEIGRLVAATPVRHRALVASAVFLGVRQSELLGLAWADVDFEREVVRVRMQLDRDGSRVVPKTAAAKREIPLMPAVARLLKEHRMRSRFKGAGDFVFSTSTGSALGHRNSSQRVLAPAVLAAGISKRVTMHTLRHCFASMLISQGADVVHVSKLMGHASPGVTLNVYAHLFDHARHADRTRQLLEDEFGAVLG